MFMPYMYIELLEEDTFTFGQVVPKITCLIWQVDCTILKHPALHIECCMTLIVTLGLIGSYGFPSGYLDLF